MRWWDLWPALALMVLPLALGWTLGMMAHSAVEMRRTRQANRGDRVTR